MDASELMESPPFEHNLADAMEVAADFGPLCPKCGNRNAEFQPRATVDKWFCRSCNWTWFHWQGRGK